MRELGGHIRTGSLSTGVEMVIQTVGIEDLPKAPDRPTVILRWHFTEDIARRRFGQSLEIAAKLNDLERDR